MQSLEKLIDQAQQFSGGQSGPGAEVAEVDRIMTICNACRYCEGFCAVFPAMTRRLAFGAADIHYLANLCHNCGACLHACQYAPPHEFAVNVPQAMAKVRVQTYAHYAWPSALGGLYQCNGLVLSLALAAGIALFLILAVMSKGSMFSAAPNNESFYAIFPHGLMVSLFAPVFLFSVLAMALGVARFWREVRPASDQGMVLSSAQASAARLEASSNVLKLKYLDGGHGQGCNNEDDRFSQARRHSHHATFYGFALCFAATSVATVYHYVFGWQAPYGYASLPKLLGISGGVLMVLGTLGLFMMHRKRHVLQGDAAQKPMDLGFIGLLFLTAATGLALMLSKGSAALPLMLCIHLGAVMALFATMPYSKFAHGAYRAAALLKFSIEKRQPNRIAAGAE